LDFTNVFYRSVEAQNALNTDLVESVVIDSSKNTSFGSVCACSMINIVDEKKYKLAYAAIYRAGDIDPKLNLFLDNYFGNVDAKFKVEVSHMVPFSI